MESMFDSRKSLSIYGFGNSGRKLALNLKNAGVEIDCFIDQRAEKNQNIEGIPCIRPSDVGDNIEQVVLGFFNRDVSPIDIAKILKERNVKNVIGYNEINRFFPAVAAPSFWFDDRLDLSDYTEEINQLRNLFKDDESLNLVDAIVKYRSSGKIEDHPQGSGLDNQYFDVNIPGWLNGENLTMLDCGAFDGDTIRSAIKNKSSITNAFCFEPDSKNFDVLSQKCKLEDKIKCMLIPCATWSKTETILFSCSEGENSRVSKTSDNSVQALAVDDFIGNSSYDFIKVDVEGADLPTLEGAIQSIRRMRPYIAVGVYHRPKDLWDVPLYLKNNLDSYRFYLRQHGQCCFDTVLYALPARFV